METIRKDVTFRPQANVIFTGILGNPGRISDHADILIVSLMQA